MTDPRTFHADARKQDDYGNNRTDYPGSGYGHSMGSCPETAFTYGMGRCSDPFGDNSPSMEERMLERRAQRMYQTLAEQGQYGQIDKARHDKNYRNYLLENYDEDGYGY